MAIEKKILKTVNRVLCVVASLCVCGFIAVSVVGNCYRSYEGLYVKQDHPTVLGMYSPFDSVLEPARPYLYERKDIVKVTRQEKGYAIQYIVSADGDREEGNYDLNEKGQIVWDKKEELLLVTEYDTYMEYNGWISDKAAREGGMVECREQVSGETRYLGVSFSQGFVCILDELQVRMINDDGDYLLPPEAKPFQAEYDSEYTIREMYAAPQEERNYWITGGAVHICEKDGYHIPAVVRLVQSILGTAAALGGAAAVILAGIRGRKTAAAIGLAVSAAITAASLVFLPRQNLADRYIAVDWPDYVDGNLADSALPTLLSWTDAADRYERIDIVSAGGGKYLVLFSQNGVLEHMAEADADWRGRLVMEREYEFREKTAEITVRPVSDGIAVKGWENYKNNLDRFYEYERLKPAGFHAGLRYMILLSFAASFVVLWIVSARRNRELRLHPAVPYGRYRVADLLYMDKALEYMGDYMYRNCKGMEVALEENAFRLDGKDADIAGYAPEIGSGQGAFIKALGMKRGILVRPVGLARTEEKNADAEYGIVFDKKRRALVYSVEERTVAVFGLKPVKA